MIQSMTGYGDAAAEHAGTAVSVEVKSLNNRYFKPVIRLPEVLSSLEPKVESLLRNRLGRGTIYCTFKLRPAEDDAGSEDGRALPRVDAEVLRSYLGQLSAAGLTVSEPERLLGLPGVIKLPQADDEELTIADAALKQAAITAAEQAIEALLEARRVEGQSLERDLRQHLEAMSKHLAAIRVRADGVVDHYHDRLVQRVNELLAKAELSVARDELLREVAVFAERSDISEEIARLTHHVEQFQESIADDAQQHIGRKLDFVAQEMLREANTIGSKAQDADIAGRVIEMKGLIDRIKEQVQNVE